MSHRIALIVIVAVSIPGSLLWSAATSQNPHGTLRWDCADCHTPDSWIRMADTLVFRHDETEYALIGAHQKASCRSCHVDLKFKTASSECADCHNDVHRGQLGSSCESCHSPRDWRLQDDILSVHADRGFPLTGVHAATDCDACHGSAEPREFAGTPTECSECHMEDYRRPTDPDHEDAEFSLECQHCHSNGSVSWGSVMYTHPEAFPLSGAHASETCESCHKGQYSNTEADCIACHETDFTSAQDPDHVTGDYDQDCAVCHTDDAWEPAEFDHARSRFVLTGAHVDVVCADCHVSGYTGTALECYSCHEDSYVEAEDPNHVEAEFGHDCQVCHTTDAWDPATIDHDLTGFPLTGAHIGKDCNLCHEKGYSSTASDCYACHSTAFAATVDPNHPDGNFDHDCSLCHTTETWSPATFDHDQTDFPLTGAHQATTCESCHLSGYAGTSMECASCHEDDATAAADPDHSGEPFGAACNDCHSTAAWIPAAFDHQLAAFQLTGAHESVTCEGCHAVGYTGTSMECIACHGDDFSAAADPDHVAGGYDTECGICHTTTAWRPAEFDHAQSRFVLTGAHTRASCVQCHADGYTGTSFECFACHSDDYAGTVDPDHVGSQFPEQCEYCHNTVAFVPSEINHELTGFPLTGAHEGAACESCHPVHYTGTSSECYACHDGDFGGAADPNHVGGQYDHQCQDCHTTVAWTPADFDHAITQFQLTGAHANALCDNCHQAGYTGTSLECFSCHSDNYASALDPNHVAGDYPHECGVCHNTDAWTPAEFNHDNTQFPLVGAHTTVVCQDCHTSTYSGTSTECMACHNQDYASVADPDHVGSQFSAVCTECHTMDAWLPATIDHDLTDFPLTGAHAAVDCNSCHTSGYTGTQAQCDACHHDAYLATSNPNHTTSGISMECGACHSTDAWVPATVNHDLTNFPLTGAHVTVACNDCHTSGYAGTPTDCFACHGDDFAGTSDPDHELAQLDQQCTACHTTAAWTPADWDHNQTQFPLTGAHTSVTCVNCHATQYAGTSMECFACHDGDYSSVIDPDHVGSNFNHNCTICHTTVAWKPAEIDHDLTRFPLTGAHLAVDCNTCHTISYTGTALDCYSCHSDDFAGTSDPNHGQSGFDHDCAICHNTSAWEPADWDHNDTQFPLTGAHTTVLCTSCHTNGYARTPIECFACHEPDYSSVGDPDHVGSSFPHVCTVCHTTDAWVPSNVNHDLTQFPLTGAHVAVACNQCHTSGYTGTPMSCFACHESDFTSVVDPNHVTGGFGHDCTLCHTTEAWLPGGIDHDLTQFPLTGAHVAAACDQCHTSGYAGTPMECFACHESDFTSVGDPNHVAGGFDHDCTLCHTTTAWIPGGIDHNQTQFPLTGAHVAVACNQCHASGYAGTPLECFACHEQDYLSVNDPNHVAGNYNHDCTICHTTDSWESGDVNHDVTQFPLTGAHIAVTCDQCHASGYSGTPLACFACHESDYSSVGDPNHVTGGFDHDCTVCHTTDAWIPGGIDHNQTQFPLTGAHTAVACNLCHTSGYAGTPLDCFACHELDYASVGDPNHVSGNYNHDCTICHSTDGWQPANVNHNLTQFPLTGAHLAVACDQCHTSGYANTSMACFACHDGDYVSALDPNHAAGNFDHDCAICHSTSGWTPANFNHNLTGFPLTGAHTGASCNQCHSSGYTGTSTQCMACHDTDYNGTTNPSHSAAGFPTTCEQCHSTTAWTPANWDHDGQYFPIYSGRHRTLWSSCADCHLVPGNYAQFECIYCHDHRQSKMDDVHSGRSGYVWESSACLRCHPDGSE